VERANEISGFIETLGIPVAVALAFGAGGWWLIRYILTSIVAKITEAQTQTEEDIRDLKQIVVGLIDKTSNAQNDLIRLDTMIRVRYGLPPDEARIGRATDQGKRATRPDANKKGK
jgi:hypothetical protein